MLLGSFPTLPLATPSALPDLGKAQLGSSRLRQGMVDGGVSPSPWCADHGRAPQSPSSSPAAVTGRTQGHLEEGRLLYGHQLPQLDMGIRAPAFCRAKPRKVPGLMCEGSPCGGEGGSNAMAQFFQMDRICFKSILDVGLRAGHKTSSWHREGQGKGPCQRKRAALPFPFLAS